MGRAALGRRVFRPKLLHRGLSAAAVPKRDSLLFTPGPLTTSLTVKQAMLVDLGSRDQKMITVVQEIRDGLLSMADVSQAAGYECVLMQGSGTFAVEGVVSSVVPGPESGGKMLVVSNGAYGVRMGKMCDLHGIDHKVLQYAETAAPSAADVTAALAEGGYTHVGVIHHETTAGTLNPVEEIGAAIRDYDPQITFIVDSMSGFGAYPLDLEQGNIHYLVSSANKNIEGVPGFAFAICRKDKLVEEGVNARTLSLDMKANWEGLENGGQFRFTPPTHALLAFHQAMAEMQLEGGVAGRQARYMANFEALSSGMAELGFHPYLSPELQGCIITTFLVPDDPKWDFDQFYSKLSERGIVIYPGKLTKAECFRLGSIGRMFPEDMRAAVLTIKDVLSEMGTSHLRPRGSLLVQDS
jgi:2-aminoethylphosphonate-pyruvate transaminase